MWVEVKHGGKPCVGMLWDDVEESGENPEERPNAISRIDESIYQGEGGRPSRDHAVKRGSAGERDTVRGGVPEFP